MKERMGDKKSEVECQGMMPLVPSYRWFPSAALTHTCLTINTAQKETPEKKKEKEKEKKKKKKTTRRRGGGGTHRHRRKQTSMAEEEAEKTITFKDLVSGYYFTPH